MSDDAEHRAISGDLAAWSLFAWFAKNQEVTRVTPEMMLDRLSEELELEDPASLLIAAIGNGGFLLRQLAAANGRSLDQEIRAIHDSGMLAHLDIEFDDEEDDPDDRR